MAKDRKSKRGQEEEAGEEVANKEIKSSDEPATANIKKGKGRKDHEHIVESDAVDAESETANVKHLREMKKGKESKVKAAENGDLDVPQRKGKSRSKKESDFDDSKSEEKEKMIDGNVKEGKLKKKGKKSKFIDSVDEDSEDDFISRTSKIDLNNDDDSYSEQLSIGKSKSSKATSQKKSQERTDASDDSNIFKTKSSGFQYLDVEDNNSVELSSDSDVDKSVEAKNTLNNKEEPQKGGKKSKKKERRKKDNGDEDLDKILEELALEMSGEKPVEKLVEKTKETENAEVVAESSDTKLSKKKKKKKEAQCIGETVENAAEIAKDESKAEEDEDTNAENSEPPVQAAPNDEEQHTVKTAAEKKREKKEKERLKKIAQFEQHSKKASNFEEKYKPAEVASAPEVKEVTDEIEDEKEDDDVDEKKKKKKKKKDEDDKKDKKRPGKKQIAAMQEALKKVQEEEERLMREEQAKVEAAEAAEQLRQEKLRLEQEKKEKKKQKEKEKRERLKAEGKLLSKTQRQNRARMEATLAALRQQGVEVPQIGEKKERAPPRYGDRKRVAKKKENLQEDPGKVDQEEISVDAKEPIDIEEIKEEEEDKSDEKDQMSSEDDVKNAWDESTDDDEESEISSKLDISDVKKEKPVGNVNDSGSESESSEESEDSESEESSSESEEAEGKKADERVRERAVARIKKRREDAENNRSTSKLRSPVVCVLGHVDTGKTKILDKIRRTHVQDSEAGGITQQIGATMVPQEALKEQCKMVQDFTEIDLQVPGLLIIDTPGHESFSNLRSRGSSLCDIAVLVVDIMHGLEPQTIESINLLKQKKTPFVVALNKVDRLYEWKSLRNKDIQEVVKSQARNTKMEFDDRAKDVILQFANQGLNAVLYYDNKDPRSYISMVPTSAVTGDGMGNLMALVVQLTQSMMAKRLAFTDDLQATVLEVKAIPGLGTTIDVILVNGRFHEGDTIILAGYEGPVVTQVRSLLMPQPLKELRVKSPYQEYKEVEGAQGVKITGKDLEKAIAGLQLLVAHQPDEIPILKEEVASSFQEAMNCIKLAERGVYVQASTLGSLEALLDFLKTSKIPYSGIRIGPVVKKDVMKASIMLEHDSQYAVILAFDVKIERDAQELADSLGVTIFQADIIYHLFDKFTEYREQLKNKKRDEFKNAAIFPCKLRILPQFVFNSRDPIVLGVVIEAGVIKDGTPLCVPSKEFLEIGTVTTIEVNHKPIECARKGQEVCIKIESTGGDAPKMFGRHFDEKDILVSKITRQSIDVCKEYFRDDLVKTDWQLMIELKKVLQIL